MKELLNSERLKLQHAIERAIEARGLKNSYALRQKVADIMTRAAKRGEAKSPDEALEEIEARQRNRALSAELKTLKRRRYDA